MPKLYEYFGLVALFYSNEHEPIHVHGKFQGREAKAEMTHQLISVTAVENLGDFRLRVVFSDGVIQDVDFRHFLQHSNHPEIQAFLDPSKFGAFAVRDGDLVWGDFELCFPIIDLYQNNIDHKHTLSAAA